MRHTQSDNGYGKHEGSLLVAKFRELRPTNGFKPDRVFTHPHYFVFPSPSNTLYAALTWHPTATLDETALGSSATPI